MTEANRVWMPDTFFQVSGILTKHKSLVLNLSLFMILFFQNEKLGHFHNIIVPNVYIRIFPTGKVLYSIRYNTEQKLELALMEIWPHVQNQLLLVVSYFRRKILHFLLKRPLFANKKERPFYNLYIRMWNVQLELIVSKFAVRPLFLSSSWNKWFIIVTIFGKELWPCCKMHVLH